MSKREGTTTTSNEARARSGWTRPANRYAVGVLLSGACLLATSCATEVPRQAAFRDDIEVGPYAFRILGAESAPHPPPPISTFRSQAGKRGVVVFVYWKTLDEDMDAMRRLAFVESFIESQFSVADAQDHRTKVFGAMQEKLMYMQDPGPNWEDWAVVFHVPEKSRDLTLLIENPEPREGQARLTAVPLGL